MDGFPVGHVGVHHACTRWLFVQLLAVEIAVKEIRGKVSSDYPASLPISELRLNLSAGKDRKLG